MSRKVMVEAAGIPILGLKLTTFVCIRGHADELPMPMVYILPPLPGDVQPMKVIICRICMMEFLAGMQARPASEGELEEVARQRAEQEKADAKESA